MQSLTSQHCLTGRLRCGLQPPLIAVSRQSVRRGYQQTVQAVLDRKAINRNRHRRIRNKVSGQAERPRLAVYRSNNHIYAQVIDDTAGHTLAAVSTLTPTVRSELESKLGANQDAAAAVGKKIAEICLEKGIEKVCYDRGGHIYHGRIKALAEAAREGGLSF